jgi:tetratricopeptide (TPR) repeat protein
MTSRGRRTLLLLAPALAGTWLWWTLARDPESAFLTERGSARWIVHAMPPRIEPRPAVPLDATFEREFALAAVAADAALALRASGRFELAINGRDVPLPPRDPRRWKRPREIDVADWLRAGRNRISVTVRNDRGPPALWLRLRSGATRLRTDASWRSSLMGSTQRPVRLASAALDATRIDPEVRAGAPLTALRARAPTLISAALLSALGIAGLGALAGWLRRRRGDADRILVTLGFGSIVALQALLYWNDAPSLAPSDGFDALGHLEYVQLVLDRGALPRPDEGWSTFHPPLYYALSALVLKLAGTTTRDDAGLFALRIQNLTLAVGHLLLLLGSIRLALAARPRAQLVAALLAGFLPMHLYLFQFVGNEGLAAMLCSASIFLGLRLLRAPRPSMAGCAVLGAVLGAALLTRLSTGIAALVLVTALAGRLAADGRGADGSWRGVGVALLVCLAVCGWHYARLAWWVGSPLAGNWDPRVFSPWWQDPGYLTAAYYTRFGGALSQPLWSGLSSFADGIYSTLWGDGLASGHASLLTSPPWRRELHDAGLLLAIVPSAAIAVGALLATRRFARRPDAVGFAVVGLAAAAACALGLWPLRHPIYSVVKAFFGLPAVLSLCVFGALGFEWMGRRSATVRGLLHVGLLVWAAVAYATFWIPRGDADVDARLALLDARAGRLEAAEARLRVHGASERGSAVARLAAAELAHRRGRDAEAIAGLRALVAQPEAPDRARLELALLLERQGEHEPAIDVLQQLLERRPDAADAHEALGRLLRARDLALPAIAHFREALGATPERAGLHYDLGEALASIGRDDDALRHLRYAARLAPEDPDVLNGLAWLLATHTEAKLRDPAEAVRQAERAAALTAHRDGAILDTLATAYAAEGRFERAVETARQALALCTDEDVGAIRARLSLFLDERPYRAPSSRRNAASR